MFDKIEKRAHRKLFFVAKIKVNVLITKGLKFKSKLKF